MIFFFKIFIVSFISFILLDMLWLGVIAKKFYQKYLGEFFAPRVNWYAALAFYIIFNLGMVFFVMIPSMSFGTLFSAALFGGAFGLVNYATYDLTNMALLKNWPKVVTFVDIAWGIVIGSVVATICFLFIRLYFPI